jgi:hypothetical protein
VELADRLDWILGEATAERAVPPLDMIEDTGELVALDDGFRTDGRAVVGVVI